MLKRMLKKELQLIWKRLVYDRQILKYLFFSIASVRKMFLTISDSESKKKVQEEALRRSKRIEDVKSASETPKRRSTVDQARSRPTRRCALKASSTRYEISATVNTNGKIINKYC